MITAEGTSATTTRTTLLCDCETGILQHRVIASSSSKGKSLVENTVRREISSPLDIVHTLKDACLDADSSLMEIRFRGCLGKETKLPEGNVQAFLLIRPIACKLYFTDIWNAFPARDNTDQQVSVYVDCCELGDSIPAAAETYRSIIVDKHFNRWCGGTGSGFFSGVSIDYVPVSGQDGKARPGQIMLAKICDAVCNHDSVLQENDVARLITTFMHDDYLKQSQRLPSRHCRIQSLNMDTFCFQSVKNGLCMVVNIKEVAHKPHLKRNWADDDLDYIKSAMARQGHFETLVHYNLTKLGMKAGMVYRVRKEARSRRQHEKVDAFVFFLMSSAVQIYGHDKLYTNDNYFMGESDIIPLFDDENCPELRGVPKFIFLLGSDVKKQHLKNAEGDEVDVVKNINYDEHTWLSDTVVVWSVSSGYRSTRCDSKGSAFSRALVTCLEESAKAAEKRSENENERDFFHLLKRMQALISADITSNSDAAAIGAVESVDNITDDVDDNKIEIETFDLTKSFVFPPTTRNIHEHSNWSGHCLIIDNAFTHGNHLSKDVVEICDLRTVFQKLNFSVHVVRGVTEEEMLDAVTKYASSARELESTVQQPEAFACIVFGRGDDSGSRYIFDKSSNPVSTSQLISAAQTTILRRKPKLFVHFATRGVLLSSKLEKGAVSETVSEVCETLKDMFRIENIQRHVKRFVVDIPAIANLCCQKYIVGEDKSILRGPLPHEEIDYYARPRQSIRRDSGVEPTSVKNTIWFFGAYWRASLNVAKTLLESNIRCVRTRLENALVKVSR